jgi:hypothetical protein
MTFASNVSNQAFAAFGALALSAVMFATAIIPATPGFTVIA